MRAWVVEQLGRVDWREDHPEPGPEAGTAVVDVAVAAPNFADSLQLEGRYQERPELPFVPGMELAGTVRWAPPDGGLEVGQWVVGTAQPGWGAWAEVARSPLPHLVPIPDGIDPAEAVALHVNAQTSWFALFHRGRAQPGEVVLVHAAAGGVGSAAVQLAAARGCTVIATCSAAKADTARALGAHEVFDSRDPGWIDGVKRLTEGRGVDVVVDPVGGDLFDGSTKVIGFEGRLVTVGYASGRLPTVAANHVLVKNYAVVGLYWGRYQAERPDLVRRAAGEIFDLLAAGRLDPLITERGSIRDAPAATARIAAGATTGKVVLSW